MVTYYNEKDVVSFGNYVLSEERKQNKINSRDEMIRSGGNPPPIEEMLAGVSHADVENWKFQESLRKSKNFLKTLGVDMDRVLFATQPNFWLDPESGFMIGDTADTTDVWFIETGHFRSLRTQNLLEKCNAADWCIFYITDESRLQTNNMGKIPYLRGAFVNVEEMKAARTVPTNVDSDQIISHTRYATMPMNNGVTDESIVKLILATCEDNGWEWDSSSGWSVEDPIGGSPKIKFYIR